MRDFVQPMRVLRDVKSMLDWQRGLQGNVTVDEAHSYATAASLSPFFYVFFSTNVFFVLMFLRVLVSWPVSC